MSFSLSSFLCIKTLENLQAGEHRHRVLCACPVFVGVWPSLLGRLHHARQPCMSDVHHAGRTVAGPFDGLSSMSFHGKVSETLGAAERISLFFEGPKAVRRACLPPHKNWAVGMEAGWNTDIGGGAKTGVVGFSFCPSKTYTGTFEADLLPSCVSFSCRHKHALDCQCLYIQKCVVITVRRKTCSPDACAKRIEKRIIPWKKGPAEIG